MSKHPISLEIRKAKTPQERLLAFQKLFPRLNKLPEGETDDLVNENVMKSAWQEIIAAANKYYETTLIGYEYTSKPAPVFFSDNHRFCRSANVAQSGRSVGVDGCIARRRRR